MKKLMTLILAGAMMLSLAACSGTNDPTPPQTSQPSQPSQSSSSQDAQVSDFVYPAGDINWELAGGAGSGPDTLMRALINELEPAMGKTIVPVNSMWNVALENMLAADADGLTISNIPTPNAFKRDLDPNNNDDPSWRDLGLVCNLVTYPNLLAVRPDDARFQDVNDLNGLIEWFKSNPNESLLVAVKSAKGADDIALYKLQNETGLTDEQMIHLNASTASENMASFLGGHVDVLMSNTPEAIAAYNDGNLKILAVFGEERSKFFPDSPTAKEQGINVVNGVSLGVVMSPECEEQILDAMADYIVAATEEPEFQNTMDSLGFSLNVQPREQYAAMLEAEEAELREIAPLLGWS